jgi:mRNA interferase RelE/StbE
MSSTVGPARSAAVANYSLQIKPSAQKELDKLADAVFDRIDRKILALAENPRPTGCKKLRGYKDQWRIRVGDWRVVYIIDDAAKVVIVTRVAHRREVYGG